VLAAAHAGAAEYIDSATAATQALSTSSTVSSITWGTRNNGEPDEAGSDDVSDDASDDVSDDVNGDVASAIAKLNATAAGAATTATAGAADSHFGHGSSSGVTTAAQHKVLPLLSLLYCACNSAQ
jgi:hypothetical protein